MGNIRPATIRLRRAEHSNQLLELSADLGGGFTLNKLPDEHPVGTDQGKDNPHIDIQIEAGVLRVEEGGSMKGSLSFAMCIRGGIRGLPRSSWADIRRNRFKAWTRDKAAG